MGILIAIWAQCLEAEPPTVSIGAVTKLAAALEGQDASKAQEFLSATETRAAAAFIEATDIQYLDRVSMKALLSELQLSSAGAFDASTGPAPGLLGRLDFLVVVEATSPAAANLRAIDVGSGALKAVGTCEAESRWWGTRAVDYSACISPFVRQTLSAARARLATKKETAELAAATARARQERQVEEERARRAAREEDERQRQADAERADQQRRAAREDDERQRRAASQRRAARVQEIERVDPEYRRVMKRYTEEAVFWDEMVAMMAESGDTFRPAISVGLREIKSKGRECAGYRAEVRPTDLRKCLAALDREVDELNSFR